MQVIVTRRWERNHPEQAREYHRIAMRNWRASNLDRTRELTRANVALHHAVVCGKIARPAKCSQCAAIGDVEAHHHLGYAKEHYLDVIWLCAKCHHKTKVFPPKRAGLT